MNENDKAKSRQTEELINVNENIERTELKGNGNKMSYRLI